MTYSCMVKSHGSSHKGSVGCMIWKWKGGLVMLCLLYGKIQRFKMKIWKECPVWIICRQRVCLSQVWLHQVWLHQCNSLCLPYSGINVGWGGRLWWRLWIIDIDPIQWCGGGIWGCPKGIDEHICEFSWTNTTAKLMSHETLYKAYGSTANNASQQIFSLCWAAWSKCVEARTPSEQWNTMSVGWVLQDDGKLTGMAINLAIDFHQYIIIPFIILTWILCIILFCWFKTQNSEN